MSVLSYFADAGIGQAVLFWIVLAVIPGVLLSLPYFFRPPEFVSENVWFFPIQFLPVQLVLRFVGWVGWMVIRASWGLMNIVISKRNAADVYDEQG